VSNVFFLAVLNPHLIGVPIMNI